MSALASTQTILDEVGVLIVDDQALVRQGLCAVLGDERRVRILGEAADGAEAVAQAQRLAPAVVIMDVNMPRLDGIEATALIRSAGGDPPEVIVLTVYDDDDTLFRALRAGAKGFLLKDASPEKLVEAIREVAAGNAALTPRAARRLVQEVARRPVVSTSSRAQGGDLTVREVEVLNLLAQGQNNEEIAQNLFLGESTVKSHVRSLYRKLGARDRAQVVVYAYESGRVASRSPSAG